MEPLRRDVLYEMVGNPETLLVDSTLLSVLHPLLRSLRARDSGVCCRNDVDTGNGIETLLSSPGTNLKLLNCLS